MSYPFFKSHTNFENPISSKIGGILQESERTNIFHLFFRNYPRMNLIKFPPKKSQNQSTNIFLSDEQKGTWKRCNDKNNKNKNKPEGATLSQPKHPQVADPTAKHCMSPDPKPLEREYRLYACIIVILSQNSINWFCLS